MWPSRLGKKLEKIVGKDAVLQRAEALRRYDFGDQGNCPTYVCLPKTGVEVSEIVREAIAFDATVCSGISPRRCRPVMQGKKSIWIVLSEMNRIQFLGLGMCRMVNGDWRVLAESANLTNLRWLSIEPGYNAGRLLLLRPHQRGARKQHP